VGAAMLCGVAGTEQATVANSVAYLKSWISRLNADSRLVVQAASAAQKAADYIRGKSPKDPLRLREGTVQTELAFPQSLGEVRSYAHRRVDAPPSRVDGTLRHAR